MGQILHGTATTTHASRAQIQASEVCIHMIAEQHHINPKTARKWKKRDSVDDLKCGRKPGQSSVLTDMDDAVIVETRCNTLLPLDDCVRPAQAFDSRVDTLQPASLSATPWRQPPG